MKLFLPSLSNPSGTVLIESEDETAVLPGMLNSIVSFFKSVMNILLCAALRTTNWAPSTVQTWRASENAWVYAYYAMRNETPICPNCNHVCAAIQRLAKHEVAFWSIAIRDLNTSCSS